jgi:uncharacterized protein (TIGR02996 family)
MADEEAFLRAIADAPGDDATRLVYADWLEEHGDAERAGALRLECAWAAVPPPAELLCRWKGELTPAEARYPPTLRRLSEVAEAGDLGWLAAVSRLGREFQALTDRFAARVPVRRLPRTPAEGSARVAQWQSAVEAVRRMFAAHVGEQLTQERFLVPADYALFALATGGGLCCPDEHGMSYFDSLYDAETMASQTVYFCDMYAEEHGRGEHLAACGLWLFVGWRDKHDLHLCCDRASPLFGVVVDEHDCHPWLAPPDGPVSWDVETRSFLDYLRWQVSKAEGPRK